MNETFDDLLTECFQSMTLEQIAEKLGLSPRALWSLRTGNVKPRRTTVWVMCQVMKISKERLFAALAASAKAGR